MPSFISELNWVDSQSFILLQRVKKWVEVNTYSKNSEGLAHLLGTLQKDFAVLKGEIASIPLPSYPIACSALSIRKRPHAPIQVLLAGHYDTVYSPNYPFQTLDDANPLQWNGPGVADMKGGLAVMLTALEAFERSSWKDQLGWEVLITPDEEIGSPGSIPLYEAAAKRNQWGLVFEPTFPDGAFVSQRKGSVNYTVTIKGRAAHVGRDFEKGRSAVFALAYFIHQLNTLNIPELTINVTDLSGEGPLNIVPPLACCHVNCRSFSLELLMQTQEQLKKISHQVMTAEGIKVTLEQGTLRPPKSVEICQPIFDRYAVCARELNIPFVLRETGGVCDGNILTQAGLPTLDTAGVIGGKLHTIDEYLVTASLTERAKLAALFLLNLAAGVQG
jgi:glutamate carboxypeptidase